MTEAYAASRAVGLSLFDTAEAYGRGRSETLLGGMIHDESADVQVATKFSPFPWRAGRQGPLRRALAASLDRLGQPRVEAGSAGWSLSPTEVAELSALGGR